MESNDHPEKTYYVMKGGDILGPYTVEELQAEVNENHFVPEDFAQLDGYPIWQPIGRVLGGPEVQLRGAVAPSWGTLGTWGWRRLRYHFDEQSEIAGVIFLMIGTLALALSRWPFVFWTPWFLVAMGAAVVLLKRQRTLHGGLLLLATVVLPIAFVYFGPRTAAPVPVQTEEHAEPPTIPGLPAAPSASSAPSTPAAVPVPAPAPVVRHEAEVAVAQPVIPPSPVQAVEMPKPPVPPTLPLIAEPAKPSPAVVAATPAPSSGGMVAKMASFIDHLTGSQPPVPPPGTPPELPPPGPISFPPSVPVTLSGGVIDSVTTFMQAHTDAFAVVKGAEGSGSSFVCMADGKPWLFTNIHVTADIRDPKFSRLDGGPLPLGPAEVAEGHDIMRIALSAPTPHPLEVLTDFNNNVAIGDDVAVLGNSGGGGVVTNLTGKVVGIGPDRIEVSAEFIPGNSGSPVIHLKTGKVIGVATYLLKRYDEFSKNSPNPQNPPQATPKKGPPGPWRQKPATPPPTKKEPEPAPATPDTGGPSIRRFAYRIDSVKVWEPVNWAEFHAEADQIRQISHLTGDVFDFLHALRDNRTPNFATPVLRTPAEEWMASLKGKHASEADIDASTESFLRALRTMVRSDVVNAEARIRYDYFRNELHDEREVRDSLYDAFDEQAKRMASPTAHTGS